jgi:foldase protein PrsA
MAKVKGKEVKKSEKKIYSKTVLTAPSDMSEIDAKSNKVKKGSGKYRNIIILVIFLALIGVFLYFAKSLFVVAMVNGKPITRLSLIRQLERTNGKTALDSLVNQTLIEEEAKKENITVTDADIQNELEKVKKQLDSQGMTLDSALSAQGMTMSDFEENLRMKQTVEQILKDKINVSDADVKKYFDDNKASYGKDAKFEDLQQSIKDQLQSDKLSTEFQTWYNQLKNQSDIKYFINFQ